MKTHGKVERRKAVYYGVQDDQGYWAGIWNDRATAELVVSKGRGNERVVEVAPAAELERLTRELAEAKAEHRDYAVARDAHDKQFARAERMRAALERLDSVLDFSEPETIETFEPPKDLRALKEAFGMAYDTLYAKEGKNDA